MSKSKEFRSQVPTENQAIQVIRALQRELKLNTNLPSTTGRPLKDEYGLEPERISSSLQTEMDQVWDWMSEPSPRYQEIQTTVSPELALNRISCIYRFLGWQVHYKHVPVETLSLDNIVVFALIKSAYDTATSYEEERRIKRQAEKAAEVTLDRIREFFLWKENERQVTAGTLLFDISSFIDVAEFLYRDETNRFEGAPYSDVPVIVLLKKLRKELKKRAKNTPPVADVALKWLEWAEFVSFVHQLELECLPQYNSQKERTLSAIARSLRRFLICALLCYLPPDRQRTLRELQEGKTLIRGYFRKDGFFQPSDDGEWYIWLGAGDYKTSDIYGDSLKRIPNQLVPYLEDWLYKYRAAFNPNHDYVFTQENGKPYTKASTFSAIIRHAAHRLTGQMLHSHLIRHMLVTHVKRLKIDQELQQSLALSMHHSPVTQSNSYDERSRLEKVLPAQQLVLDLAMGILPRSSSNETSVEDVYRIIRKLSVEDFEQLMCMLKC